MYWYLISTIVILIIYILVFKRQKTWIQRNVKQVCTTPIVGDNMKQLLRTESLVDMVKNLYNAFPNDRYMGAHQMTLPILLLRDPELIKQLTVKDFDHFTDHRSFVNNENDVLWNRNLFALRGEEWRDMRSTLSPAFTGNKMRAMFTLINDCAKQFTTYFLNKTEDKIELVMKDTFRRYANDVIATCAFGITVDSMKDRKNEFYVRGKEITDFTGFIRGIKMFFGVLFPSLAKFLNIKIFGDDVSTFFKMLISDSIKLREREHIVRPDLINLLMEARKGQLKHEKTVEVKDAGFATVEESHIGKVERVHAHELSDIDITAQALLFFFAGFDTVSAGMSFLSYELAVNPDVQDKLIEEVDETFKACKGDITYDSLAKMKYMDMVLSEILRKWPPLVGTDRLCVRPYTIQPVRPDEHPVPIKVGEVIWVPIMGIHHDPEYYENPDKFDPERFNDENKHKINPYTYMPFGVGPRNCIGSRFALMEIKTVIFNILTKFKFVPTKKSVIPLIIDKKQFNPTSEGGFWMALQKR